jgi:hypothetical protein
VFVKNAVNSAKHVQAMISARSVFRITILLEVNAMHSEIVQQVLDLMVQLVFHVLLIVNLVSLHKFAHIATRDIFLTV